jgi:chromosome partitioning protein
MFDRRSNLSEAVASDARTFFGSRVHDTIIPRSVRLAEASSHGEPVVSYDRRSAGADAYIRFAKELAVRLRLPQLSVPA